MKAIQHMHDFISELPDPIRADVASRAHQRKFAKAETVYCQGDLPTSMYQIVSGSVKLCNYSLEGAEFIAGEFRQGDCFGEMGLVDGLPRVSHAVATSDTVLQVIGKQDFDALNLLYPEFSRQVMLILCRRVRYTYGLHAEATGHGLHERLAVHLYRLAHSHGCLDESEHLYVAISQEELGRMLGASRQSINKELKTLAREGSVDLRYGKIYLTDLAGMEQRYGHLLGEEQITAAYGEDA